LRNLSRTRAAAVVAVVSCLVAGVVATTWLTVRGPVNPSGPARDDAVRTVPVAPDRETTVAVDGRWSVTVPAGGAGPGAATLTVSSVTGLASPGRAQHPLAGAALTLSSGQPAKPLTFTYRLDQPLPADQVLYLLDDDADGAALRGDLPADRVDAARVHAATLSPDRRVATVSVAHLSFKEWLSAAAGDLTQALGRVFGQRAGAPECTGARPACGPGT
jgi:hypothetical protein